MRSLSILALLASIAGCTSQQAYYAGQQWQGSQCGQLVDKQDYDTCMSRNRTDYNTYQKEREQVPERQVSCLSLHPSVQPSIKT